MLAVGTGWKLFDCLGHLFNFNGVLPGSETVTVLIFFSVIYNVNFT